MSTLLPSYHKHCDLSSCHRTTSDDHKHYDDHQQPSRCRMMATICMVTGLCTLAVLAGIYVREYFQQPLTIQIYMMRGVHGEKKHKIESLSSSQQLQDDKSSSVQLVLEESMNGSPAIGAPMDAYEEIYNYSMEEASSSEDLEDATTADRYASLSAGDRVSVQLFLLENLSGSPAINDPPLQESEGSRDTLSVDEAEFPESSEEPPFVDSEEGYEDDLVDADTNTIAYY